jgi:hypothetical protein
MPAIRHAVISMAAMHREFVNGQVAVVSYKNADDNLRFAIEQSSKAIQTLRGSHIEGLAISILFYCIFCFEGQSLAAIKHLRSGLRILREVEEKANVDQQQTEDQPISIDALRTMFIGLDTEVRSLSQTWEPITQGKYDAPSCLHTPATSATRLSPS